MDTSVDEFVRGAILEAWTTLVLTGKVARASAEAFLADYPVRANLDTDDFGWSSWTGGVTALGLTNTREIARRHLRTMDDVKSITDMLAVTIADHESQMAISLADPEAWRSEPRYQPFSTPSANFPAGIATRPNIANVHAMRRRRVTSLSKRKHL